MDYIETVEETQFLKRFLDCSSLKISF